MGDNESRNGVVVFIPFLGGLGALLNCVEAVEATVPAGTEVVLYQDNPPAGKRVPRLGQSDISPPREGLRLVDAPEGNQGFVDACNWAFKAADDRDVILLNSDTVPVQGWFEALLDVRDCAWHFGAVSAMSDNATIFTAGDPSGRDLVDPAWLEVPTCNGFCMLVSRKALDTVGWFDSAFSPGYGEEVDWCQRVRHAGFRCYAALNGFVRHVGSATFDSAGSDGLRFAHRARAEEILRERYPSYPEEVRVLICSDAYFSAVVEPELGMLGLVPLSRPVVIHVVHSWAQTGGVEVSTRRLIEAMPGCAHLVICPALSHVTAFRVSSGGHYVRVLEVSDSLVFEGVEETGVAGGLRFGEHRQDWPHALIRGLRRLCSDMRVAIHAHHLGGFGAGFLHELHACFPEARVLVDLHDRWLQCPNRFMGREGVCCAQWTGVSRAWWARSGGAPLMFEGLDSPGCASCEHIGRQNFADGEVLRRALLMHQSQTDSLLDPAKRYQFVAPSWVAAAGFACEPEVVPPLKQPRPKFKWEGRRVVAFVGSATLQKGWGMFRGAVALASDQGLGIEWCVIGELSERAKSDVDTLGIGHVGYTVCQEAGKSLVGVDVLVPAMGGDHYETYCMVADECAATGLPMLVRDDCTAVIDRYPKAPRYGSAEELLMRVWHELSETRATADWYFKAYGFDHE